MATAVCSGRVSFWNREVERDDSGDAGDRLARLLLAAQEDPAFRARLLWVLRLPRREREPLLRTAIEEMRLRGESAEDRAVLDALTTDSGAETALRALGER